MSKTDGYQSAWGSNRAACHYGMGGILRTWTPASDGGRHQGSWLEMENDWPNAQLLMQGQINLFDRDDELVLCSQVQRFGSAVEGSRGLLARREGEGVTIRVSYCEVQVWCRSGAAVAWWMAGLLLDNGK